MSFFGAISDTASNLWSSATSVFADDEEDQGPISVPVTPEMEETARAMNQRADDWAAAGHTQSPYEEKRALKEKDMYARDAGFRDSRDQQEFRDDAGFADKAVKS